MINRKAEDFAEDFVDTLLEEIQGLLDTTISHQHFDSEQAKKSVDQLDISEPTELTATEAEHSGELMRVNHCGEVCAQALYRGQALTTTDNITRKQLLDAAEEEKQHLLWCEQRLQEVGSKPSILNPVFYAGSLLLGSVVGLTGQHRGLGFVAETEAQVERHLETHLDKLPKADARSRAIVSQMIQDEQHHGQQATNAGGKPMPKPISQLMHWTGQLMVKITEKI